MITILFLIAILIMLVICAISLVVAFGLGGWIIALIALDVFLAIQIIKGIVKIFRRKN